MTACLAATGAAAIAVVAVGSFASPAPLAAATVPDEYVLVHDDHGLLQVEVPVAWGNVDTRPFANEDQTLSPAISATAAPEFADFTETYDYAGIVYEARPVGIVDEEVFAEFDESARCDDGGRTPYDDGAFAGSLQAWNYCGGGSARVFVLVTRPIGQEFMAVLWAKTVTPQDEVHLTHVLATFNARPSVGMPTETAPPETTPAGGK